MLTIKKDVSELSIDGEFDRDNELTIRLTFREDEAVIYLTPDYINDIITHLIKTLKGQNKPITLLKDL